MKLRFLCHQYSVVSIMVMLLTAMSVKAEEQFLVVPMGNGLNITLPMPPHISRFNASSRQVVHGQRITLSWDSYKATTATLNDAVVPLTGSQQVTIMASQTFVFKIHTPMGIVQQRLFVAKDTDRDGHRDELDGDDDNDGLLDVQELKWGLNPYDNKDALIDSDQDGISNLNEVLNDKNPFDAQNFPSLYLKYFSGDSKFIRPDQTLVLSWDSRGASALALYQNDELIQPKLAKGGSISIKVKEKPDTVLEYKVVLEGPQNRRLQQTWTAFVTEKLSLSEEQILRDKLPVKEAVGASLTLPTDAHGDVYLANYRNQYFKLSGDGNVLWQRDDLGLVMSRAALLDQQASRIFVASTKSKQEGLLTAMDSAGNTLWQALTQGSLIASPVLDIPRNRLYVVDFNGRIYAFSLDKGKALWDHPLGEAVQVRSSPVLKNQDKELVIRTKHNFVFAIDLDKAQSQGIAQSISQISEDVQAVKWKTALGAN